MHITSQTTTELRRRTKMKVFRSFRPLGETQGNSLRSHPFQAGLAKFLVKAYHALTR